MFSLGSKSPNVTEMLESPETGMGLVTSDSELLLELVFLESLCLLLLPLFWHLDSLMGLLSEI